MFPRLPASIRLPVLLLLGVLAACAPPRPHFVQGDLVGSLVWQGEVRLQGDVVLSPDARLQILPGTEVIFLPAGNQDRWVDHPHFPGSELIVRGTLLAEGTPEAPIVFRFVDSQAPAGSWGGINLTESPAARFRYCRFTQADSALHSWQSTVSVADSLFEHNLVALRFNSSDIHAERNLLRRNGTAIRFHFGAPRIAHNEIRDNDRGLFITSHPSDYLIEENNFSGNRVANVVLGEEVPDDVMLPRNWWGSSDPQVIVEGFFDGRRVDYLGRIRFEPALLQPADYGGNVWNQ